MDEIKVKFKKPKIDKGDLLFYCAFLAWPVLQFCVFYIGVNFNSVLLSFRFNELNETGTELITRYWTLESYKEAWEMLWYGDGKRYIAFTLKAYLTTNIISVPLGLLFAYYIFKKLAGWSAFRVVLFLPSILSGVVVGLIYRYLFAGLKLVIGVNLMDPVDGNLFLVLMFYNVWISFGTNVLMYSNKMSSISDEIIESAHLDGAVGIKEFWYIVLPLTYSTLSVFLITGVASMFVHQYGVIEMFNWAADDSIKSIGFWFFAQANQYKKMLSLNDISAAGLPTLAAMGIIMTIITVPIALTVRWALEKYGPSEE
jgi:ABC-type sugar transport system permease subunit